ncbi:MAG: thiamine pyrophosphate-binding protein, partial [Gammaproteobacteria bacterium]
MAANGDDIGSASLIDIVSKQDESLDIAAGKVVDLPTANSAREFDALKNTSAEIYEIGDLLVSYLDYIGVEYVFGIPGGAIEPLYNALSRSAEKDGPRAVVARHETGAAFMADGYA